MTHLASNGAILSVKHCGSCWCEPQPDRARGKGCVRGRLCEGLLLDQCNSSAALLRVAAGSDASVPRFSWGAVRLQG